MKDDQVIKEIRKTREAFCQGFKFGLMCHIHEKMRLKESKQLISTTT